VQVNTFTLGISFQITRKIGKIASRKRLRRILRETSKEVVKRICLFPVGQIMEKERILVIRVILMEDHHI
jgi:hypothetical protein